MMRYVRPLKMSIVVVGASPLLRTYFMRISVVTYHLASKTAPHETYNTERKYIYLSVTYDICYISWSRIKIFTHSMLTNLLETRWKRPKKQAFS